MKKIAVAACVLLNVISFTLHAQTNIICTNANAELVMQGNYDSATYMAANVLNLPDTISKGILARVSPDSLHSYLNTLKAFHNRNTSSDTLSPQTGMGAARTWVYNKFQSFSSLNENRLLTSFLQFDLAVCNMGRHKNIFAVLPGMDTADKSVIVIEGHIDSRCADVCDTACLAQGMEDNATGTALVLELARVMAKYSYNHTIVFLITTGEEQGLYGATAFADYVQQKNIKVKAVMNNDVIGGIICGYTSSAPSCPGFGNIDSTDVRLFSYGGFNSFHKGLSRYIKLEYHEMIQPFANVPMTINIMTPEDRTGRSGDHIPFRPKGIPAMRFTSANEDGDADVTNPSYIDRQHTSSDTLGVDLNNDGTIDSFFVDFDYLSRNAVINGNAAGMAAISPVTPDFDLYTDGNGMLVVNITQQQQYLNYRVGVRSTTNDWDSVYTFTGTLTDTIHLPQATYIVSVASVDDKGVESLFSRELYAHALGVKNMNGENSIELLQNRPNPADEATNISVIVSKQVDYHDAYISIKDLNGKEIKRMPITLKDGMNEVQYYHGYGVSGTYIYTLYVDGKALQSKRMIFTN